MSVPRWFTRPLRAGDSGRDVEVLRRLLDLGPGAFDARLDSTLRGRFPDYDDVLTAEFAAVIGPSAEDSFLPEWYNRPLEEGDQGFDVMALNALLGLGVKNTWDKKTTSALKRWQSASGFKPDGVLTETIVQKLGNLN